ncbi:unnamed protein product [Thelazia callipaeda]|uniref:Ovule protein n=1 Tax=Thelazia callipaeda TaxID=103827 RepID=A0A0N5CYL2_THECL|nr:unnamed protein product [Thelazia callipaeda]
MIYNYEEKDVKKNEVEGSARKWLPERRNEQNLDRVQTGTESEKDMENMKRSAEDRKKMPASNWKRSEDVKQSETQANMGQNARK